MRNRCELSCHSGDNFQHIVIKMYWCKNIDEWPMQRCCRANIPGVWLYRDGAGFFVTFESHYLPNHYPLLNVAWKFVSIRLRAIISLFLGLSAASVRGLSHMGSLFIIHISLKIDDFTKPADRRWKLKWFETKKKHFGCAIFYRQQHLSNDESHPIFSRSSFWIEIAE